MEVGKWKGWDGSGGKTSFMEVKGKEERSELGTVAGAWAAREKEAVLMRPTRGARKARGLGRVGICVGSIQP